MTHNVITFYKYTTVEDPETLRESLRAYCEQHDLMGRILLGKEGINGGVCGTNEAIEAFKTWIEQNPRFADLTYRELPCDHNVYHRLVVRVRDEIVVFGENVDLAYTGKRLSPQAFKKLMDQQRINPDPNLIVLDTRNDYEFDVGKFFGATHLNIRTFRDFAKASTQLADKKDKKIVMYCTGGIRCEKASAYFKEQGFQDVSQLEGGIINYANQFPNTHFEGACFVFDDRLAAPMGAATTVCTHCGKPTSDVLNCHNLDCDKLFVCCGACQGQMQHTCSEDCKCSPRQRVGRQRQRK